MGTHAQRGSLWRVGAGALLMAAAMCGGCSVLFHADAKQCSTTTDCTTRGTAFTGYTCSLGTCVAPECTKNTDCASLGANYMCSTFLCVAPVAMLDGGSEAEAAVVGCMTNMDCKGDSGTHPEVACDVDTHTCLQLTTDDCPVVIGQYAGKDMSLNAPIFLGAFVTFPTGSAGPLTHPTYLNYQLALDEFRVQSGGIPAGPGTAYRVPVAIGCDIAGNIDNAMNHLVNELHVPTVVAPLASTTLSYIFQNYTSPNNVLTINPLGWDSTLAALTTNGLLWHMLGKPSDNAPAYAAFLPVIENYLRVNPPWKALNFPWSLGATRQMKVATVTANSTVTNDLSKAVTDVLTWNNGKTIAQNENGAQSCDATSNYCGVTIIDSTLNGTSLSDSLLSMSILKAAQTLADFQPDVTISFASEELVPLIQDVEIDRDPSATLPFYVVGPYNMASNNLQNEVNNLPYNTKQFAGIGVASAPDPQMILANYVQRFLTATNGRTNALGEENYYDAMYFAVYSLVASGRVSDPDLATGMKHLISLTSTAYQVGPVDQGNIFSVIGGSLRGQIDLLGTLGPPLFDTVTGARVGAGDVYCFQDTDAGTPRFAFDYDVLRLTNADGSGPPDGGSPFQGTFPCYPGIQ